MSKSGSRPGLRFVSMLLIVGGIAGIFIVFWLYSQVLRQSGWRMSSRAAILGLFLIVFGWSTCTGIDLWQYKAQAYKWAKILFAAQIPIVNVGAFSYEFHTGLAVRLILGSLVVSFNFHVESSMILHFSPARDSFALGVNLVAIAVLAYLMQVSSPSYGERKDTFGLISSGLS